MNDSKRGNDWGLRGFFRRAWFSVFPPAPVYRERQRWYW